MNYTTTTMSNVKKGDRIVREPRGRGVEVIEVHTTKVGDIYIETADKRHVGQTFRPTDHVMIAGE